MSQTGQRRKAPNISSKPNPSPKLLAKQQSSDSLLHSSAQVRRKHHSSLASAASNTNLLTKSNESSISAPKNNLPNSVLKPQAGSTATSQVKKNTEAKSSVKTNSQVVKNISEKKEVTQTPHQPVPKVSPPVQKQVADTKITANENNNNSNPSIIAPAATSSQSQNVVSNATTMHRKHRSPASPGNSQQPETKAAPQTTAASLPERKPAPSAQPTSTPQKASTPQTTRPTATPQTEAKPDLAQKVTANHIQPTPSQGTPINSTASVNGATQLSDSSTPKRRRHKITTEVIPETSTPPQQQSQTPTETQAQTQAPTQAPTATSEHITPTTKRRRRRGESATPTSVTPQPHETGLQIPLSASGPTSPTTTASTTPSASLSNPSAPATTAYPIPTNPHRKRRHHTMTPTSADVMSHEAAIATASSSNLAVSSLTPSVPISPGMPTTTATAIATPTHVLPTQTSTTEVASSQQQIPQTRRKHRRLVSPHSDDSEGPIQLGSSKQTASQAVFIQSTQNSPPSTQTGLRRRKHRSAVHSDNESPSPSPIRIPQVPLPNPQPQLLTPSLVQPTPSVQTPAPGLTSTITTPQIVPTAPVNQNRKKTKSTSIHEVKKPQVLSLEEIRNRRNLQFTQYINSLQDDFLNKEIEDIESFDETSLCSNILITPDISQDFEFSNINDLILKEERLKNREDEYKNHEISFYKDSYSQMTAIYEEGIKDNELIEFEYSKVDTKIHILENNSTDELNHTKLTSFFEAIQTSFYQQKSSTVSFNDNFCFDDEIFMNEFEKIENIDNKIENYLIKYNNDMDTLEGFFKEKMINLINERTKTSEIYESKCRNYNEQCYEEENIKDQEILKLIHHQHQMKLNKDTLDFIDSSIISPFHSIEHFYDEDNNNKGAYDFEEVEYELKKLIFNTSTLNNNPEERAKHIQDELKSQNEIICSSKQIQKQIKIISSIQDISNQISILSQVDVSKFATSEQLSEHQEELDNLIEERNKLLEFLNTERKHIEESINHEEHLKDQESFEYLHFHHQMKQNHEFESFTQFSSNNTFDISLNYQNEHQNSKNEDSEDNLIQQMISRIPNFINHPEERTKHIQDELKSQNEIICSSKQIQKQIKIISSIQDISNQISILSQVDVSKFATSEQLSEHQEELDNLIEERNKLLEFLNTERKHIEESINHEEHLKDQESFEYLHFHHQMKQNHEFESFAQVSEISEQTLSNFANHQENRNFTDNEDNLIQQMISRIPNFINHPEERAKHIQDELKSQNEIICSSKQIQKQIKIISSIQDISNQISILSQVDVSKFTTSEQLSEHQEELDNLIEERNKLLEFLNTERKHIEESINHEEHLKDQESFEYLHFHHQMKQNHEFESFTQFSSNNTFDISLNYQNEHQNSKNEDSEDNLIQQMISRIPNFINHPEERTKHIQDELKSQNEIICSSKQIQKQIKIISSIQDISNQISILSQVDVSKFTTSEQLSEHQEELDNLIEERNKLLEFLNTERKHIEESINHEEHLKDQESFEYLHFHHQMKQNHEFESFTQFSSNNTFDISLNYQNEHQNSKNEDSEDNLIQQMISRIPNFINHPEERTKHIQDELKSQNEIICSSKQIQKQIKIISSIQDISNQISILSQVDVSKFATSEQLSEHQEELDNLIEERNKLLEFLNTERKHIEESINHEEHLKDQESFEYLHFHHQMKQNHEFESFAQVSEISEQTLSNFANHQENRNFTDNEDNLIQQMISRIPNFINHPEERAKHIQDELKSQNEIICSSKQIQKQIKIISSIQDISNQISILSQVDVSKFTTSEQLSEHQEELDNLIEERNKLLEFLNTERKHIEESINHEEHLKDQESFEYLHFHHQMKQNHEFESFTQFSSNNTFDISLNYQNEHQNSKNEDSEDNLIQQMISRIPNFINHPEERTKHIQDELKSQNEIICSSKQIQKQIKIISSIQDISNQISILSQVDVSKFTTSEQLSEHQEELDNLIEERNKLLEFLNTERKHIEESRHFEEDIKLFEQITLNNEIKFVFHYEEEQSSKEIHRLHELIRETQRTKLNDEYSQENISRKNEQINMKKIKIRRGIIKVCIASEEHNHRLKRGEKYNQYLFDYVTTYPNKNIKLDIYDEQQATLDIEDPTPQLFDPTQLHAEFYQDDKWLKASDYQLGSLGESLFNFLKQNVDIPEYVEPFAIETNRILRKTMSKIDPKDIQNNSHYFTNAHKLFSLICESPKKFPYRKFQKNFELTIGELFALLVKRITAIVKEDFFICVNQGLRCFDAEIAVTRIVQAQCSICAPLNTIIWQHVLRTVDCKLANYIIDDKGIPDFEIMMKVYDVIKELEKILNIKMPYSDQAYSLIKNYPKIIQDSTPFEVAAPNLPPDFVVGLIFTGKKKNMIPFEISDDRIIKFADYLRLDISKAINYKLKIDESKTNLPSTLWLVPKKK